MQTDTIVYIIISGIVALILALFQYKNKKKSMSKLHMLFSFLRFITLFSILLLLINPKFKQEKLTLVKPNLAILIDNSTSIKHLNQTRNALHVIDSLFKNKPLNSKFNVSKYIFGEQLRMFDSIKFLDKYTNIYKAFNELSQVFKDKNTATILISDGNQTIGNDYEFVTSEYKNPIYPIILGDTVTYSDLKIQQLNSNRYAFLKNRFPIEAIISYNGNTDVRSNFVVKNKEKTLFTRPINFTKEDNSKTIRFTLLANKVGINNLYATITPIKNEKNTINNSKNFAVEVIDQKTKIVIVSDFFHPDLGALKKSIESNKQRTVFFLKPNEIESQINDFQLIVLNQPNNKFKEVFSVLDKENKNTLIILGTKTDLKFINNVSKSLTHEITNQTEEYQAKLNLNYSPFIIDDINFESFPPLLSNYGAATFMAPYQVILNKTVNGIDSKQPLLITLENKGRREAILFGENIWKWRAQSFINTKSFDAFDGFISKTVQFLASGKQKSRLNIDYQSFYNTNTNLFINAQFFDKNYKFDPRASLSITVNNVNTKKTQTLPLILKNRIYQVDLSSLVPSTYNFTVKPANENISKSGTFQILEYNIEQQFFNADVTKLKLLATNSGGAAYFVNEVKILINDLLTANRYVNTQKSNINTIPLINWRYLLILIVLCLALEWFLRKYNGLI